MSRIHKKLREHKVKSNQFKQRLRLISYEVPAALLWSCTVAMVTRTCRACCLKLRRREVVLNNTNQVLSLFFPCTSGGLTRVFVERDGRGGGYFDYIATRRGSLKHPYSGASFHSQGNMFEQPPKKHFYQNVLLVGLIWNLFLCFINFIVFCRKTTIYLKYFQP